MKPAINSMNDIYILISSKQYDKENNSEVKELIAYIPREVYSDPKWLIEEMTYPFEGNPKEKELCVNQFFLNDDYVYPINLAGPAVSKVIQWNIDEALKKNGNAKNNRLVLDKASNYFQSGYFIDLRQLKMSRLNMVQLLDKEIEYEAKEIRDGLIPDTPIPYKQLKKPTKTFVLVPPKYEGDLKSTPPANIYIAFFDRPNLAHNNIDCYSYKVSYIPLSELKALNADKKISIWNMNNPEDRPKKHEYLDHLQTYYGDAGIQAGALNPLDIQSPRDGFSTNKIISPLGLGLGLGRGGDGDGGTCYVANLATFKK